MTQSGHCRPNLIAFENWRRTLRRVTCAGEISSKLLLFRSHGRSLQARSSQRSQLLATLVPTRPTRVNLGQLHFFL
jgi:hypothetical protein